MAGLRGHRPQICHAARCTMNEGSVTGDVTTTSEEPAVGIEPTTARLRIECSTTELRWRYVLNATLAGAVNPCPDSDSNRDAFRHYPLKIACLPVSPSGRGQHYTLLGLTGQSPSLTGVQPRGPPKRRVIPAVRSTVVCRNGSIDRARASPRRPQSPIRIRTPPARCRVT